MTKVYRLWLTNDTPNMPQNTLVRYSQVLATCRYITLLSARMYSNLDSETHMTTFSKRKITAAAVMQSYGQTLRAVAVSLLIRYVSNVTGKVLLGLGFT